MFARGFNGRLLVHYVNIKICMSCKYKQGFRVQVKNKPCVDYIVIMRLIPWIHSRGSETITMAMQFVTD
jgi:hypothetical protein